MDVARAGPPLITEDPDTPGDGKWEINLAFTLEQTRDERSCEAPLIDINYGVAVDYPLNEHVELLAEIAGTAQDDFDENELVFNLGAKIGVHDNLNLLISAGRSFRESSSGEPELLGYFGLQFLF